MKKFIDIVFIRKICLLLNRKEFTLFIMFTRNLFLRFDGFSSAKIFSICLGLHSVDE